MTTTIEIQPVVSRASRGRFLDVPRAVYATDPAWIEPLRAERRLHISSRNPFFDHAEGALWIAHRDGRPVGRISAQIDRLHQEQHDPETGFFGMLEAEDDPATFAALFGTAESWLRDRGMRRVLGPFHFGINQECGLLVDGFDTPPHAMMPHGRPYYGSYVEELGYEKEKDLLAYLISTAIEIPHDGLRGRERKKRYTIRPLVKSDMDRELETIRNLFNDAWSENWGFVPFTDAELKELGALLKHLVPENYVLFAERNGEPVAFLAALPNVNEAAADLKGSLFPLGWARLLWRLKRNGPKSPRTARIALLGLRGDLRQKLSGGRALFALLEEAQRVFWARGVQAAEVSWILEDNEPAIKTIEAFGGDAYKRYRIYRKELG